MNGRTALPIRSTGSPTLQPHDHLQDGPTLADSKRTRNTKAGKFAPPAPDARPRTVTYTVSVDDNYHYQDAGERYSLGEYNTWDAALAAGLYGFGEDPFISGDPPESQRSFSAWDYAKRRCEELCGNNLAADREREGS